MGCKLSIKVVMALAMNPDGLNYKQVSEKTKFHINTVSRYVSYLESKNIVHINQEKSNSIRGRKWINIVKLNEKLLNAKNITEFFVRVSNQLNDLKSD